MKLIVVFAMLGVLVAAASASEVECGVEVKGDNFRLGEKITFKPRIEGLEEYNIEYWIEDSDGNAVKKPRNTTNKNNKVFTPKEEGRYVIRMTVGSFCSAEHAIIVGNGRKQEEKGQEEKKQAEKRKDGNEPKNTLAVSVAVDGIEKQEESYEREIKSSKKTAKNKPKPKSKAAALVIWFMLFLLTLFCIVLIWRR